jgi:hypothetical protein
MPPPSSGLRRRRVVRPPVTVRRNVGGVRVAIRPQPLPLGDGGLGRCHVAARAVAFSRARGVLRVAA